MTVRLHRFQGGWSWGLTYFYNAYGVRHLSICLLCCYVLIAWERPARGELETIRQRLEAYQDAKRGRGATS